jgi:quinohemoprotein ethanol dehydrogenase
VPGDPKERFESAALEEAAKTWNGEYWKLGGGGTVWDSMAYDPELRLLYVGTGNGSPWRAELRSPGGGDNLFLSSILALSPDTGEIVWHYQTTPADNWDFTATQHMILADLPIAGELRKVILQAPKNGFFYVLDRKTGEFLSAAPYVPVSWADGVDAQGRPIPSASADYESGLALVTPMYLGGHNWQPMSFNPVTGLVYIPAQEMAGPYRRDPIFEPRSGEFNTGVDNTVGTLFSRELVSGHLLAWDPIAQKEVWRHPHGMPWNGGTLTTAGNLVFQGTADGRFLALRADDGYLLWQSHSAGTGIGAAPVSYRVGGVQYVAVVAGWGGAFAQVGGDAAAAAGVESKGRVLAWALVDESITPEVVDAVLGSRDPEVARAADLYHNWCWRCHGANGIAGGVNPDLRGRAGPLGDTFAPIVANGIPGTSMPGFSRWLADDDIRAIQVYLADLAEQ